jgi:ADP-ribosyl-[dinitrogen reductase] hydrolase
MERYVRWWKEGYLSSRGHCFDVGTTTAGSLRRFGQTGDPFSGPTGEGTAGNGSLMRLATVPLHFRADPLTAIGRAGQSSATTHGARTAGGWRDPMTPQRIYQRTDSETMKLVAAAPAQRLMGR